jgi:hypothetical protein
MEPYEYEDDWDAIKGYCGDCAYYHVDPYVTPCHECFDDPKTKKGWVSNKSLRGLVIKAKVAAEKENATC